MSDFFMPSDPPGDGISICIPDTYVGNHFNLAEIVEKCIRQKFEIYEAGTPYIICMLINDTKVLCSFRVARTIH